MRRKRRYISVCAERGCPELTDERFCETHRLDSRKASEAKRETAQAKGYDARWRQTRKDFLRAYPVCQDEMGCVAKATDVDHIDGLGPNGPRGHDWTNLRAFCHSHHSKRTAKDQPGGFSRGARATGPFIILAGESGVGKTTIREQLARKLNAPTMGPDDYDGGWRELYDDLDYAEAAIVECVRLPYGLRRKMKEREAKVVELKAPAEVRERRLQGRGEPDDVIDQLMVPSGGLGYEDHIEPDLVLNTDRPAEDVAAEIVERLVALPVGSV